MRRKVYEPHNQLPTGKYVGKTIADVYSGNAGSMISAYRLFLEQALEQLFSPHLYNSLDSNIIADIRAKVEFSASENKMWHFIIEVIDGANYRLYFSQNTLEIAIFKSTGNKKDNWLTQIACEIAQAYAISPTMTRGILVNFNNLPWTRKPSDLLFKRLKSQLQVFKSACGNPEYIHACIKAADWFCMRGSEEEIPKIDDLPIFKQLIVKTSSIKDGFSFDLTFNLISSFKKISAELALINYERWFQHISQQSTLHYSDEDLYQGDDEYYSNDNDEDDIMRGLENGNGDLSGY